MPSIFVTATCCGPLQVVENAKKLACSDRDLSCEAIFTASTISTFTMGMLITGTALFSLFGVHSGSKRRTLVMLALLITAVITNYFAFIIRPTPFAQKYAQTGFDAKLSLSAPLNVLERVEYRHYYIFAITAAPPLHSSRWARRPS